MQSLKSTDVNLDCRTLTYNGDALMVKVFAGDTNLKFTKLKIGNGKQQAKDSIKELTDLINPLMELSIQGIERNQNNVIIKSNSYFNSEITEDIYWNELGVYAEDPDDGEILFAVLNSPDAIEYIPSATSGISIENGFAVMLIISSDVEVSAVIKSIQYATKDELEAHISDNHNPHNVTAEDVGLGNIKNVAFSDNEVEFETGKKLVNFNPKNTLKNIISVCWSAIDTLINHINPVKTNPHKTSYEDIKSDSGWKEIIINENAKDYFSNNPQFSYPMKYKKLNGVVYLTGAIQVKTSYAEITSSMLVCTLPEGYRPDIEAGQLLIPAITTMGEKAFFFLSPTGELVLDKLDIGTVGGTGGISIKSKSVGFNISFPTK